ncbi:MAG: DUF3565 domain-containing protein [Gammaproteobacteria bacterium]|nr:DUF3565 domain-containing protein [Gammaproteobacteria bacterium]
MEKKITGFHQDEFNDWVADLECGHTQHVRHNPPWITRPWVTTEQGRQQHLGRTLLCKDCNVVK